jgi:HD superfamily phosphohydrolase
MNFFEKQINDPVHGVVGLSSIEIEILSTKVFQRLHNVKQLGLGVLVYPGANYSRFSHSMGACHLAGQMVDSLSRNSNREFDDKERQLYRLGGLLHDIGHYPFSHTFEHVIENIYKDSKFLSESPALDVEDSPKGEPAVFDHELMGRKLIENDDELKSVFERHGFTTDEIRSVFTAEDPQSLVTLISSDLDCDRLDYLMRTALHAGLPYGKVDVPYIISQLTLDSEGRPCLNRKAVKAADHFLISRYFDYTQVPFHKAVTGLEIALEEVLRGLISRKKLNCSSGAMLKRVQSGEWCNFDDQHMINLFRTELDLPDAKEDALYFASLVSVLRRKPPKLVLNLDRVEDRDWSKTHKLHKKDVESRIANWSAKTGIDRRLWHVWSVPLALTKMGSVIRYDVATSPEEPEKDEGLRSQLIWIKGLNPSEPELATPITSARDTLVRTLCNKQFYGLRVYVNLSVIEDGSVNANNIRKMIQTDIGNDLD